MVQLSAAMDGYIDSKWDQKAISIFTPHDDTSDIPQLKTATALRIICGHTAEHGIPNEHGTANSHFFLEKIFRPKPPKKRVPMVESQTKWSSNPEGAWIRGSSLRTKQKKGRGHDREKHAGDSHKTYAQRTVAINQMECPMECPVLGPTQSVLDR